MLLNFQWSFKKQIETKMDPEKAETYQECSQFNFFLNVGLEFPKINACLSNIDKKKLMSLR